MHKRIIKSIFKIILFAAILLAAFTETAAILKNKDGVSRHKLFYQDKNDVDALFFGSSHTECSVSPLRLWHNFGIASYNMGNSGERIEVSYWNIKDSIERKKPQVVFLDMFMLNADFDTEFDDLTNMTMLTFDGIPLIPNKIDAVWDLYAEAPIEKKLEFLFTFSVYHSRWKNLGKRDFEEKCRIDNGAVSYDNVNMLRVEKQEPEYDDVEQISSIPQESNIEYLDRIVSLCKDNEIKLVLVYFPFVPNEANGIANPWVKQYAEINNIEYIDFNAQMDNIDLASDFFDSGHTNLLGVSKVTDYIGYYLSDKYDIEDKRNNDMYSDWNNRYVQYYSGMREAIHNVEDVDSLFYGLIREE